MTLGVAKILPADTNQMGFLLSDYRHIPRANHPIEYQENSTDNPYGYGQDVVYVNHSSQTEALPSCLFV